MEVRHLSQNEVIQKGITCGTAAGAKQGRMKGNHQKAEYKIHEGTHKKLGGNEWGKHWKRKLKMSTEKAAVRQRREEMEREKQKAE